MKRLLLTILLTCGVICPMAGEASSGNFGANPSAPAKVAPATTKRNSYPYSGELESVDEERITLKGKKKPRVILLTEKTRVLRNGAKAKLSDAVPGERVSGSVRKNAQGQEEATTLNLKGVASE